MTMVLPLQAVQEWFIKKEVGEPDFRNVLHIAVTTNITYRFARRLEGYGEWTLDDARIKLFGFGGANVPYKAAYLVGVYSPDPLGNGKTKARLEYAFSTEQMGLHRDPSMALFNDGVPIGHSMGPDSDTLFLRLDQRLSGRDSVVPHFRQAKHCRHKPMVETDSTWGIAYARDITSNAFVTASVQQIKSDSLGNVAGTDGHGTRVAITASGRY